VRRSWSCSSGWVSRDGMASEPQVSDQVRGRLATVALKGRGGLMLIMTRRREDVIARARQEEGKHMGPENEPSSFLLLWSVHLVYGGHGVSSSLVS